MREISLNKIAFDAIIDKGTSLPVNDGTFKNNGVRLFLRNLE